MDYSKIRINLEETISNELFEIMEGDILESLLKEAKIEKIENEWKYILEGHSFKVTNALAPSLYALFNEVKEKLGFKEEIEFYVSSSSEVNAFAIASLEEDEANIINLNSRMIEFMDDEELKFIIGHEIGHLISKNARIMKLINFVFPDYDRMPLILRHKIELWTRLAELTSDRFGYIASPNIEKCISGFFKLSSGLNTNRINFDYKAYLIENEKILKFFAENKAQNLLSHPINPIRIKAIEIFRDSELYKAVSQGKAESEDKVLEEKISPLTNILLTLSSSELDYKRNLYYAAAGLIMAGIDKEVDRDEYESIVRVLSARTMFPKEFLHQVIESNKVNEVFQQSAAYIIQHNPAERYSLFEYLIGITISDREIIKNESQFPF